MNLRFVETSRHRNVLFAVELLDAVTLERVNQGITVDAQGLRRKPVCNSRGLFVWIKQTPQEDTTALRSLAIDTGELPYQSATLDSSQVQAPPQPTTILLAPRVNYPFQAGVTGLRGTLIESNFGARRPVLDGIVRLQWIDHSNNWIDSPPVSKTETDKGDFVAILRFLPNAKPDLNADGTIQVRLQADRPTAIPRYSTPFKLTPGRLSAPVSFAWDELNP
jgi:hypothetical protein